MRPISPCPATVANSLLATLDSVDTQMSFGLLVIQWQDRRQQEWAVLRSPLKWCVFLYHIKCLKTVSPFCLRSIYHLRLHPSYVPAEPFLPPLSLLQNSHRTSAIPIAHSWLFTVCIGNAWPTLHKPSIIAFPLNHIDASITSASRRTRKTLWGASFRI